jgi:SAM-dependent methyltransferase
VRSVRGALLASPPGQVVTFGRLSSGRPASRLFGYDRGTPIDRTYIEDFLERNRDAVRGRVLEFGDSSYTHRFGGSRVTRADVLDVNPANPAADIRTDLTRVDELPEGAYDCVICTQVLLLIYDVRAAVAGLRRLLAPGGVALVTLPAAAPDATDAVTGIRDHWRFTGASARALFADAFGSAGVRVVVYGNALSAAAFIYGFAAEEMPRRALAARDPLVEVTVGVRASVV